MKKGLDLKRKVEWVDAAEVVTEAHSGWSTGWLAKVTLSAPGAKYDLSRTFINPDSTQLSRAGNGSKTYELEDFEDGYYEADSVWRSSDSHRVFFQVKNNRVTRWADQKAELKRWLRGKPETKETAKPPSEVKKQEFKAPKTLAEAVAAAFRAQPGVGAEILGNVVSVLKFNTHVGSVRVDATGKLTVEGISSSVPWLTNTASGAIKDFQQQQRKAKPITPTPKIKPPKGAKTKKREPRRLRKKPGWKGYDVESCGKTGQVVKSYPTIEDARKAAAKQPDAQIRDKNTGSYVNKEAGTPLQTPEPKPPVSKPAVCPAPPPCPVPEPVKPCPVPTQRPVRVRNATAKDKLGGLIGQETVLLTTAAGCLKHEPAHYRLTELDRLKPSHNGLTFKKTPGYPEGTQERRYATSKTEQQKVISNAQASCFEPSALANTDPTPVGGAPIVTLNGIVLGGNSRTMVLQRVYSSNGPAAAEYRRYLKAHAPCWGFDEADVAVLKQPVLVRAVDAKDLGTTKKAAVRRYNEGLTQELDVTSAQVATSARIDGSIVAELENMGADETLTAFLSSRRSAPLVRLLQAKNVIPKTQVGKYIKDGLLNEDGRRFFARALVGKVLPDADALDLLFNRTPSLRGSLARAVPYILRASEVAKKWDVTTAMPDAARLYSAAKASGKSITAYLKQRALFDAGVRVTTSTVLLAQILMDKGGPLQLSSGFREYAQAARGTLTRDLFASPAEPVEALASAFGLKLVDAPTVAKVSSFLIGNGKVSKPASKPAAKPAAKPASKPAAKPGRVVKSPAKPAPAKPATSIRKPPPPPTLTELVTAFQRQDLSDNLAVLKAASKAGRVSVDELEAKGHKQTWGTKATRLKWLDTRLRAIRQVIDWKLVDTSKTTGSMGATSTALSITPLGIKVLEGVTGKKATAPPPPPAPPLELGGYYQAKRGSRAVAVERKRDTYLLLFGFDEPDGLVLRPSKAISEYKTAKGAAEAVQQWISGPKIIGPSPVSSIDLEVRKPGKGKKTVKAKGAPAVKHTMHNPKKVEAADLVATLPAFSRYTARGTTYELEKLEDHGVMIRASKKGKTLWVGTETAAAGDTVISTIRQAKTNQI